MHLLDPSIILGAITTGSFFSSGTGKIIQSAATLGGILTVIGGIAFAVRGFMRGEGVSALKFVLGSVLVGAFLMNLTLIDRGLSAGQKVVNALFDTGTEVTG